MDEACTNVRCGADISKPVNLREPDESNPALPRYQKSEVFASKNYTEDCRGRVQKTRMFRCSCKKTSWLGGLAGARWRSTCVRRPCCLNIRPTKFRIREQPIPRAVDCRWRVFFSVCCNRLWFCRVNFAHRIGRDMPVLAQHEVEDRHSHAADQK